METRAPSIIIISCTLLPIREAYEWKQHELDLSYFETFDPLLPIREAYEWKHRNPRQKNDGGVTCFQFVKRMNGNQSDTVEKE